MNIAELIAQLMMNKPVNDQNRREAGMSVLPGQIGAEAQMLDLRRQMLEAYRTGDYDRAQQLQNMMAQLSNPRVQ